MSELDDLDLEIDDTFDRKLVKIEEIDGDTDYPEAEQVDEFD